MIKINWDDNKCAVLYITYLLMKKLAKQTTRNVTAWQWIKLATLCVCYVLAISKWFCELLLISCWMCWLLDFVYNSNKCIVVEENDNVEISIWGINITLTVLLLKLYNHFLWHFNRLLPFNPIFFKTLVFESKFLFAWT